MEQMKNMNVKVADLIREYDNEFVPSKEYLASMPDLQNGDFVGLPINFVGMAGIKRPMKIRERSGGIQEVCATIIGHVDNDSNSRGINMSRINRELAVLDHEVFDMNALETILRSYQKKLDRFEAGLSIEFEYRMWQPALRSTDIEGQAEGGWIYIPVEFELTIDKTGKVHKVMWVSYIYSSTCPCSTELATHAALTRGRAASPHAQRSIAKIGVEFEDMVWIEDVVSACKKAVATQVQIFVKRQDEQAFGELCASKGTVFVEDAIRLFANELDKVERIKDYKIMCGHAESLHPWLAHAVLIKNVPGTKFTPTFTNAERRDLERYV